MTQKRVRHNISNFNEETREADCDVCGPVYINRSPRIRCTGRKRPAPEKNFKHKLIDIRISERTAYCFGCGGDVRINLRKSGIKCSQILRSDSPSKFASMHVLENINPTDNTADCNVCGPGVCVGRTESTERGERWACGYRYEKLGRFKPEYQHPDPYERRDMMLEHGLFCDICGEEPAWDDQWKTLNYDHDHTTGLFRGWLCRQCNQGLGHFKDSPKRLTQAIEYLIRSRNI